MCGRTLYIEEFLVNKFGVNEEYLTDSVSFRLFVGKVDVEHETLLYNCENDSIKIEKYEDVEVHGPGEVTETRYYRLSELIKKHPIR